jgi:hypothetical protein
MATRKGTRKMLNVNAAEALRRDVERYQQAAAAATAAQKVADAAKAAILEVLGDTEGAVDTDGLTIVIAPERTRRTVKVADVEAIGRADLVNLSTYRVVGSKG